MIGSKKLPMTGFETRISGVECHHFTNCATAVARGRVLGRCQLIDWSKCYFDGMK